MDNIRIYQERNVKELLAKLENTLVTIHQYVNSYLAYNLRMLAAAIDATYLRKVLQELLDSWCNRLPSIGEEGVDINWEGVIERLYKARYELIKRKNGLQPVKANIIKPLSQEQKKWSSWQSDLHKEERGVDTGMDSSLYRLCLNPMEQENLWCFASNDYGFCNKLEDEDLSDMRSFLRTMSPDKNLHLEEFLMYEIDRIQTLAANLNDVLTKPYKILGGEQKCNELFPKYLERISQIYAFKADMLKDEFNDWLEDNREVMNKQLLLEKRCEYWRRVQESGFLEGMVGYEKPLGCMKHFFNGGKLKEINTGRYIYMRQFRYANWWEKVEIFITFGAVNTLIEEAILQYDKEGMQSILPTSDGVLTRNELIARSIRQLMEEKEKNNKGMLIKYNNQWIAIHRILMDFYGFSDKYVEFMKQMEELKLSDVRIPCTLDGIKKVDGILSKDFNEWASHKTKTNSQKIAFRRQYNVAVRLLEILEANKVEKIKKEPKK